ncbi:RYamide receptor-like [Littorina saxatilis]|uniref:G-protein coupled receptors family 1 profile domain-containing protein n=1 Tax=Littorina saxatilis TaxID=31220 RepID=A0AAN9BXZ9_9CAEN
MATDNTSNLGDLPVPSNISAFSGAGSFGEQNTHLDHNNEILVNTDYNPRLANGMVVAAMMVVGLVGNSLVLYVYNFKMPRTVFSTFVTVLAALDLATTLIGMPIDVVIKSAVLDKSDALTVFCKVAHWEVYSTSLASGSVLLLITITRHTKVCKPLEPGLTKRKARFLCALLFTAAMALCTVTLVINGLERVKIAVGERDYVPQNTTGDNSTVSNLTDTFTQSTQPFFSENTTAQHDLAANVSARKVTEVVQVYICRTSEEKKGTALHYALQAVLMLAFVVILFTLLVLHCKISSALTDFERRHSSMRRCSTNSDSQNTHITASMFRIFASITVIFAVSYLPHLVCLIVEKMMFSPGQAMPQASRVVMDLAYNFPYINVIANPFIYGYRSAVFRQHCLELLYRLCRCCYRERHYR